MPETFKYHVWLADAALEDRSVDEVGLWFGITAFGQEVWKDFRLDEDPAGRWMLDLTPSTRTLVIHAKDGEAAEEALTYWLSMNPGAIVVAKGEMEVRDPSSV